LHVHAMSMYRVYRLYDIPTFIDWRTYDCAWVPLLVYSTCFLSLRSLFQPFANVIQSDATFSNSLTLTTVAALW